MSGWSPEYANLAVAVEALIKEAAASGLGINKEVHGRGLQGLLADPKENYLSVLSTAPQVIHDQGRLVGAVNLANALANRESYLTKSLSTAPGMEFHHEQANAAVVDSSKTLPMGALLDFHTGLGERGIHTGANPDSGKVITAWGHRLGAKSAHVDPYTKGSNPKYWSTVPLNLPTKAFTGSKEQFVEAVVNAYAQQKGKQQQKLAMDVWLKEAPIREQLEALAPTANYKSNALRKRALLQQGITPEVVMELAKTVHGSQSASESRIKGRRSPIHTTSFWNIARPDVNLSVQKMLRM